GSVLKNGNRNRKTLGTEEPNPEPHNPKDLVGPEPKEPNRTRKAETASEPKREPQDSKPSERVAAPSRTLTCADLHDSAVVLECSERLENVVPVPAERLD